MNRYLTGCRKGLLFLFFGVLCARPGSAQDESADEALRVFRATGATGGLVVHLGCGTGRLTVALAKGNRFVVQGLDTDRGHVERARAFIQSEGLSGRVSVDQFDGRHLPYVDNLVNVLVVNHMGTVSQEELMRVLAPLGTLCIRQEGRWTTTRKRWPAEIDEWPAFLHGPDNNAVAKDEMVGPPRSMQWLAGPRWTRDHHADKGTYPTIRAVLSARGRLFYMVDETPSSDVKIPSTWRLVARDAFSGVLLWKQRVPTTIFERRLEQLWRTTLTDGVRVYAPLDANQSLVAVDAATGAAVRTYADTAQFAEVIEDDGTLFVVTEENNILALQAETGRRQWSWQPPPDDPLIPLTMAATDGKVFTKTDRHVYCLAAADGKVLWRHELPGPDKKVRLRFPREKLLVADGVVLCSFAGHDPRSLMKDRFQYLGSHPRVHEYGGKLAALDAADGHQLWQADYFPGLESTPGEIYVSRGVVWAGPAFDQPRDLHTGIVRQTRPVLDRLWTTGHHYRCYPGKATTRYVLTSKRGVEFIDLAGNDHSRNNWVRGTCRVGVTPCNGLLYAPPHSCGCYMEAKLSGFWSLAPRRAGGTTEPSSGARLERGPAYGVAVSSQPDSATAADWPTYRGNAARSGSSEMPLATGLEQRWQVAVGGPLSAVTVANGRVYVARVDAHAVVALDAHTGKSLWQFTAGGRVDSPPTIHGDLVLFGAHDGRVYCLRAADGALVWQFLAAPRVASAVACEQIESLWPVYGSVLVQENTAYVAAGRSSYLDGGISLYALQIATGRVVTSTRLASQHAGAMDPPGPAERAKMDVEIRQNRTDYKTYLAADRADAFSMSGALTGIMSADNAGIFMRHLRFDHALARQDAPRPHLFSTSTLLDGTEHNRSYWVLGTGDFSRTPVAYPWIVSKNLAVPYGLMLVFDRTRVWGVHRVGKRGRFDSYLAFAASRPVSGSEDQAMADFAERTESQRGRELWRAPLSFRPRALVRAGNNVVMGGLKLAGSSTPAGAPAASPVDRASPGLLRVVSSDDGSTVDNVSLTSSPVWDGLAVAHHGAVFAALEDGSVICLAGRPK